MPLSRCIEDGNRPMKDGIVLLEAPGAVLVMARSSMGRSVSESLKNALGLSVCVLNWQPIVFWRTEIFSMLEHE